MVSLILLVIGQSAPLPERMGALGDSMTEAIFANYSNEKGLPTIEYLNLVRIATLEASKRMDAFRRQYAALKLSWATGDDPKNLVQSHFERLRRSVPQLKAWNFAVAGAEMAELSLQVDRLLEVEREEGASLDYLTVLIGENNLMQEDPENVLDPSSFGEQLYESIKRVLDEDSSREILLMGPPPIFQIFDESEKLLGFKMLGYELNCGELRRTIYGRKIPFVKENLENYAFAQQTLQDYLDQIDFVAERLSQVFPTAHIKSVRIPKPKLKAKKILSIDCFHPSEWGQAELAETTWKLGFWPKL